MNRFKDGELIGVEKSDRGYVCWIYKWSLLVRGTGSYSDRHYSDSSYSDMLLSMAEFYA